MKEKIKRTIKVLFVLIISIISIYLILTLNRFIFWCNNNQIILFNNNVSTDFILENVDREAINSLGENIEDFANTLEKSKSNLEAFKGDGNFTFIKDGQIHSYSEYYNPLGFSIWSYLSSEFQTISILYIDIAILWGIVITSFYIIISNPKINYNIKFAIGYFVIMVFIIQMYGYLTGIFRSFIDSIKYMPLFYIIYTLIFFALYFINRKKYKKIVESLNNSISTKNIK